jgi:hypothetical protein
MTISLKSHTRRDPLPPTPAPHLGRRPIREGLRRLVVLASALVPFWASHAMAAPFDAAPFGLPLPDGNGVMWEDPREIHRVVVYFQGSPPPVDRVRLEYWGSWWPERHLPKDREPGGGDNGWMELGNWYKYGWRTADTEVATDGQAIAFTFRPVNASEFPKVKEYPAAFRYTLKVRVVSDDPLPPVQRISALTDSVNEERTVRLAWANAEQGRVDVQVFNGAAVGVEIPSPQISQVRVRVISNPDPNTFDRTLVTVRRGKDTFTFKVDDVASGPIFLPHIGVAVLPDSDIRDYAAVAAAQKAQGTKTLYERVAEMPEQTWHGAWDGVPRKKSRIYFPMGLDGGRQRFRLNADGSLFFRSNDHFLMDRPGQDTSRLSLEKAPVRLDLGLSAKPSFRTLQEESLPVCLTTWDTEGVTARETALVTELNGTQATSPTPPADAFAVFVARLDFTNVTDTLKTATLPLSFQSGDQKLTLRVDAQGLLWSDRGLRGQVVADTPLSAASDGLRWSSPLAPGQSRSVILKVPYLVLTGDQEREALMHLDFDRERTAVAGYWRRQLDRSARLVTPEPTLNEFYRSHAMHLLVNCEREPGSDRRFARVGSFDYGAYGNESCMMVVDLDRRGYHQEAQNCLDAWLHYQSTVALPGSFASKDGVLYGAGGYEAGGYNQHHGWILWMLAEHYRFTRDDVWLRRSSAGIVKACDWIINETKRTADRPELERGLLPAGSLEDIGDWWTWLSTSCYTWRGLDSAAWALEQIQHLEAARLREAADTYHRNLLANFRAAAARSPVVRLRDGTAIPHIPSHVHRRGRCFGWICETLEGALHLLITRALDPNSEEATWILKDYEDNLYLSNQYGYTLDDFDKYWFGRGGMSMQACLLLDVEPYLYRDDVKHALRALFNGQAVSYFPDVRMNTEHALPDIADWRGDQFKSSDESNTAGWLRSLFVREEGEALLLGQAVPREWLQEGRRCGIENSASYFGPTSVLYSGGKDEIIAQVDGPRRNPPKEVRVRFRDPQGRSPAFVTVNEKPWTDIKGEWVQLPGSIGTAVVKARYESQ